MDWTKPDARTTPVPTTKCLFCKKPRDKWDTDVTPTSVGGGEVLCSTCLGDLRMYGRYQYVMAFASGAFGDTAEEIIKKHWENARNELLDSHPDDAAMFPVATVESDAEGRTELENIDVTPTPNEQTQHDHDDNDSTARQPD